MRGTTELDRSTYLLNLKLLFFKPFRNFFKDLQKNEKKGQFIYNLHLKCIKLKSYFITSFRVHSSHFRTHNLSWLSL